MLLPTQGRDTAEQVQHVLFVMFMREQLPTQQNLLVDAAGTWCQAQAKVTKNHPVPKVQH